MLGQKIRGEHFLWQTRSALHKEPCDRKLSTIDAVYSGKVYTELGDMSVN